MNEDRRDGGSGGLNVGVAPLTTRNDSIKDPDFGGNQNDPKSPQPKDNDKDFFFSDKNDESDALKQNLIQSAG